MSATCSRPLKSLGKGLSFGYHKRPPAPCRPSFDISLDPPGIPPSPDPPVSIDTSRMKKRSNRGAARVNAIWLIVTLVLFFAAMFFGYTANDEAVKAQDRADRAEKVSESANANLLVAQAELRLVSELIGYYDETDISATTVVEQAQEGFNQFKATIGPDADEAVDSFQKAWPLAIQQVASKQTALETVSTTASERQTEITAARSSAATVAGEKDTQIATLRKELQDLQTKYTEETNGLEGRIARLTQERQTGDESAIAARNELADVQKKFALERSEYEARLTKVLAITRPPREPNSIDGSIVGTSAELNIAYINLGTKDRVVRGMVFQVLDADASKRTLKGEIEILNVNGEISEAAIRTVTDKYNTIAVGDKIANPLYDPEGERNALLVGRFDGKYNSKEIKLLMEGIGINIQDKLDRSTMYLIMGNPLYRDPETGEALEEPINIIDLPVYAEAKAFGVQMISIEELRHFFRL